MMSANSAGVSTMTAIGGQRCVNVAPDLRGCSREPRSLPIRCDAVKRRTRLCPVGSGRSAVNQADRWWKRRRLTRGGTEPDAVRRLLHFDLPRQLPPFEIDDPHRLVLGERDERGLAVGRDVDAARPADLVERPDDLAL